MSGHLRSISVIGLRIILSSEQVFSYQFTVAPCLNSSWDRLNHRLKPQKNLRTKLVQKARWLTYQPFAALHCSGVKWFNRNFFVLIFLIQLCSFVGF
jgi:hypothetical protein